MKQAKTCIRILAFATLILLVLYQNPSLAKQQMPPIDKFPVGSINVEVIVTKDMIKKKYYYRVSYVTRMMVPIWTVFYNKKNRDVRRVFSPKETERISFDKFSLIGPWAALGGPGPYLIGVISLEEPKAPGLKDVVHTLRISSNTEQNIKDNKTLIVDGSTGVAPRKGTEKFNIRYLLNEPSDMTHKIIQFKDNKEIWNEERTKVEKGTRGFDWNRENAQKDVWYKAEIGARLVSDKSKWDHDLSAKFQNLK